jgi:hypothetical protein
MTYAVLWGIWPAIVLGALVSHMVYKWRLRPLQHFKAAQKAAVEGRLQVETVSALKSIYRWAMQRVGLYCGLGFWYMPVCSFGGTAAGGDCVCTQVDLQVGQTSVVVLRSGVLVHVCLQLRRDGCRWRLCLHSSYIYR